MGEYGVLLLCGLVKLGEYAHARACYEQSLAILPSAGDRAWESIALLRMGLLLQRLGEAGAVEPLRILLVCCSTLQTLADERTVDALE